MLYSRSGMSIVCSQVELSEELEIAAPLNFLIARFRGNVEVERNEDRFG